MKTHIETVDYSAVASQSVNNVFSSTFDNYFITVVNSAIAGATDVSMTLRLRASGTDTSANYSRHYIQLAQTGLSGSAGFNNQSNVLISNSCGSSNPNFFIKMDLFSPNLARRTTGTLVNESTNNSSQQLSLFHNFNQISTTQFDGFSIILASGTMTGTITIYGYQK